MRTTLGRTVSTKIWFGMTIVRRLSSELDAQPIGRVRRDPALVVAAVPLEHSPSPGLRTRRSPVSGRPRPRRRGCPRRPCRSRGTSPGSPSRSGRRRRRALREARADHGQALGQATRSTRTRRPWPRSARARAQRSVDRRTHGDCMDGPSPSCPTTTSGKASIRILATSGREELLRRQLALREELAHLGAREEDVVVAPVRAGLRRRHLAADLAPERVLEEHRLDVELVQLEVVEDRRCAS